MKKFLLLAIVFTLSSLSLITNATQHTSNYLHIIPETTTSGNEKDKNAATIVEKIWKDDWRSVNDRYNEEASKILTWWDIWLAFETGVMNWDILLSYVAYVIRFINQLGILIWSIMILYAGYQYATSIFWWNVSNWKNAIKNAIIWIIVIVFSYAIWAGLEAMFL